MHGETSRISSKIEVLKSKLEANLHGLDTWLKRHNKEQHIAIVGGSGDNVLREKNQKM